MPTAPASMAERLALDEVERDVFVAHARTRRTHLFGGLLLGHATRAAASTVRSHRLARSLHASFVVAGNATRPVRWEVERTRDGRSFSTRRVVAVQGPRVLLVATVDFQDPEDGADYAVPATPAASPDDLPAGRYETRWFESRDVPIDERTDGAAPARRAWFRARQPLPDNPALHQHALAYLTDHGPTRAVREPHADHPGLEQRRSASLDHAVWFHRAGRVDEWVLYEVRVMSTANGRGLAFGTVRDQQGTLLASVAQEALLRLPAAPRA